MNQPTTLARLLDEMDSGQRHATELLESCFERIETAHDANAQIYTRWFDKTARAEADAIDRLREAGLAGGQLAGLPIALKALF
ncbi:MAG TPA: amidase, partial [Marinobacter sp.]